MIHEQFVLIFGSQSISGAKNELATKIQTGHHPSGHSRLTEETTLTYLLYEYGLLIGEMLLK